MEEKPGRRGGNLLGGGLMVDTDNLARSGKYEIEINDMAKTSMFGGALNSAELPKSPAGSRLCPPKNDDAAAESCFSVKGSSVCPSPSPTHKADRLGGGHMNGDFGISGISFLDRMAQ